MARFATPGVYVKENNAFSNSVVAAPTAIPAFIGYTEKAERGNNSLLNSPSRITSLKEYIAFFGRGPKASYKISQKKGTEDFELEIDKKTQFNLYNSLRLFYANGGGLCYIVSVGDYKSGGVKVENMLEGVDTLIAEQEPSIVLCPDATILTEAECNDVYKKMLMHCGKETKDRFAILDVYRGNEERTFGADDVITNFREGVGTNFLGYAAAYYPWLNTTIVNSSEVSFKNISNHKDLVNILTSEAQDRYLGGAPGKGGSDGSSPKGDGGTAKTATKGAAAKATSSAVAVATVNIDERMQRRYDEVSSEIKRLTNANGSTAVVNQNLKAISPKYNQILGRIRELMNVQPTCGIIAGIYAMVDNTVGVHKAPANVSLNAVLSPTVNITAQMQEDLNVPINGKAVNAIRTFIGKGVLIWGARTLDGNSQDWRYINVRRTLLYIEQSVKSAVENYVFAPNTPQTWLKVKVGIDNFLTGVWRQGALLGISPAEAYEVVIGLGSTMTPEDVLDGVMRISVFIAVARPAEFVEITFEQKMQEGVDEGGDDEGDDGGDDGGDEGGDE